MIYIRAYIYHNHNLSLTDFIFNEFSTLFRIRRYDMCSHFHKFIPLWKTTQQHNCN